MSTVGTIVELWRYPVKSMLGERCESLHLDARGIEGDRRFAVRYPDGKFGSGKSTRRFRKMEGLFRLQASYRGSVPYVRFPTGELIRGDDPAIDAALSNALGASVTLACEAEISHFDAGPVHLLTSGSLAWLRASLPSVDIDARRFRPNLVVAVSGKETTEQSWLGKRIRIGAEVELAVTTATERCGMVTFAQDELREAPRILRQIAQHAEAKFGVYAEVRVPGVVHLHDRIAIE